MVIEPSVEQKKVSNTLVDGNGKLTISIVCSHSHPNALEAVPEYIPGLKTSRNSAHPSTPSPFGS